MEFQTDYYAFADEVVFSNDRTRIRFDSVAAHQVRMHMDLTHNANVLQMIGRYQPVQIEMELPNDGPAAQKVKEGRWYELKTSTPAGKPSGMSGLFYELGVSERGVAIPVGSVKSLQWNSAVSKFLQNTLSLANLKQADLYQYRTLFEYGASGNSACMIAYDVGQGSCAALYDCSKDLKIFFDLGGGIGPNAGTYRKPPLLRPDLEGYVVLSHWDMDHWIQAKDNPELCRMKWIVPDQKPLGISHLKLAATIAELGQLWVLTTPGTYLEGVVKLQKLPFNKNRNYSGIVASVTPKPGESILVPGDAPYNRFRVGNPQKILVPHHGGYYRTLPPKAPKEHMVVYSYGEGNTFGHPADATVIKHEAKGWSSRSDTNGHDVLVHSSCNMSPHVGKLKKWKV